MHAITQIRKLSIWIFLVPLLAINICLIISQNPEFLEGTIFAVDQLGSCLLYTSPSPRDVEESRMPSSA